ncbi:MAG TPA: hypothetical protein VIY51_10805 [Xanthobacteraceae bacterium]
MANIRTTYRTTYRTGFAALMLATAGIVFSSPAQAAATCTGTLAQYTATIKQLEAFSAKAQALVDQNPLYIADVEYYASALSVAQSCAKSLGAVATVSR